MKDKILPPEYDQSSLEELTEKANKIIDTLEKENDLSNSLENYQELLRLNNIIEKKFQNTYYEIWLMRFLSLLMLSSLILLFYK